jgi:hypothetical protein
MDLLLYALIRTSLIPIPIPQGTRRITLIHLGKSGTSSDKGVTEVKVPVKEDILLSLVSDADGMSQPRTRRA